MADTWGHGSHQPSEAMNPHERVAFMPIVKLCLRTERPRPYSLCPSTLGEHLNKRRIEAGLFQRQVALQIGVTLFTLINWEKDRTRAAARHWPKIIEFLGHDPNPEPEALGDRLKVRRRRLGLSRKQAARRLGIDEETLRRVENGSSYPKGPDRQQRLAAFIDG